MKNKEKQHKYINMDDNIAEILEKYPETAEVFLAYGLHCVGCFANAFDTVRAGAQIHAMSEEEVGEMLEEVNYVVEQGEKDTSTPDGAGQAGN